MPRPPLIVVAVVAVVVAALLAGCGGTESSSGPTCGGSRTVKVGDRTWTCTFSDEFDGDGLDRDTWTSQRTGASGWTTSDTCYVDDPANIAQSGGALHLVARRIAVPMSCGRSRTVHTGAAVITKDHFSQTHGLFVFRARFPATRLPGFWGNLWLYPEDLDYGAWPGSGEVDVAEHWSGHGDTVAASMHYTGSTGADSRTCAVADVTRFHTYALDWEESTMSFYYDGRLCFTRDWTSVTGSTKPFDKPFFVMLSEGYGDFDLPTSPLLPPVGSVDVDYVHVYR